jgi:protoporphyrinogen oxidase
MDSSSYDVVIIGGGLAGLTAARRLHRAGKKFLLIEAADAIGGRVRTDRLDGFLLDRGFQIFLTAYPEARHWLDYPALGFQSFAPGARVWANGQFHTVGDPWRQPATLWSTLRADVGSVRDKLGIARLRASARRGQLEDLWQRPEQPARDRLLALGFSERMLARFFTPFLGGVFLERELRTSSRMLDFVFRMFADGDAVLPAGGMESIPRQLAAGLPPEAIRLGRRVVRLARGEVALDDGSRLTAREIILATDGTAAAALLGIGEKPAWTSATCLYFAAPVSPVGGPWLVLNGEPDACVNNLAVLSDVQPGYAPAGQSLIAATIVGNPSPDDAALCQRVRAELRGWYGPAVDAWRHLRTYRIREALPAQPPPLAPVRELRFAEGLVVCGDWRTHASIQGAMESGRRAADIALGRD